MRGVLRALFVVGLVMAPLPSAQAQVAPQVMSRPPISPQAVKAVTAEQKKADEAVDRICTDVTEIDVNQKTTVFHCISSGGVKTIWSVSGFDEQGAAGVEREATIVQTVVAFMTAKAANPGSPLKLRVTGKDGFVAIARRVRLIR